MLQPDAAGQKTLGISLRKSVSTWLAQNGMVFEKISFPDDIQ